MALAALKQGGGLHPSSKALVSFFPDTLYVEIIQHTVKQETWIRQTQSALMFAVIAAGVHHVFDTNFSRTFSLLESQREFLERFQSKEQIGKSLPMMTSACPGIQLKALHIINIPYICIISKQKH